MTARIATLLILLNLGILAFAARDFSSTSEDEVVAERCYDLIGPDRQNFLVLRLPLDGKQEFPYACCFQETGPYYVIDGISVWLSPDCQLAPERKSEIQAELGDWFDEEAWPIIEGGFSPYDPMDDAAWRAACSKTSETLLMQDVSINTLLMLSLSERICCPVRGLYVDYSSGTFQWE
ncbi:hypothetical protein KQI84_10585 [bacterium]|nr:hypothetical protein [bacterium]